ncbi:MAG: bifunctional methylenetetrahydrofolate dehydrogenase/methenyltetrahydrofolate cyclohydrolase FolD [Eubacteriales bacterium]|nr:bifunctional methylenetetrahydrofolate dehydrogenase/methenyltetrahydrofolate cyclohydrolase FolD [Eubacteriales bacterium]
MKAKIIDGKAVAKRIRDSIASEIQAIVSKTPGKRSPGLAVIIAGDDPASRIYVNSKKKVCESLGIYFEEHAFPGNVTEGDLLEAVSALNSRDIIDGILIQLPLPSHINEFRMISALDPDKDVDGLHPVNLGKLVAGMPAFTPCTPTGVIELIRETGTAIKGKNCTVIGRSILVGKPQALLLLAENGTVTMCHSKTPDLGAACRNADILVSAVGSAGLVRADMVKPGAVVIDVGTNRRDDGKLCGDVDFDAVSDVAGHITPVPGGVGPMTIAMLMQNTLRAYHMHE